MIRLLFLIGTLNRGGAERQLTLLVNGIDRSRFKISVVTIYDGGALRSEIENQESVQVLSLRKQGRWDVVAPLYRLFRVLRTERPHIVHGYMGVANVLAFLFGRGSRAKVVWGIRASDVDYSQYDRISRWHFRLSAWLSRFIDVIVTNSYAGKRHCIDQGFSGKRMLVIPNGFDTDEYQPDQEAGRRLRQLWGITEEERLIGLVARLDPMKDHQTFMEAAAELAQRHSHVRFVCVGDGAPHYREQLKALAEHLGLGDRLIWAGPQDTMRAVQNALNIATSASAFGEGVSNSIGEAMACGVPCVATDVGDSALLVGDTGLVVKPRDPAAMAAAWARLLELSPSDVNWLGMAARQRIVAEYSIQQLVRRSEAALVDLLARPAQPSV